MWCMDHRFLICNLLHPNNIRRKVRICEGVRVILWTVRLLHFSYIQAPSSASYPEMLSSHAFYLRMRGRTNYIIPFKSKVAYILIFGFQYFEILKSTAAVYRTVLVCIQLARFRVIRDDISEPMAWRYQPTRCRRAVCIKESLEVTFSLSLTSILRSPPLLTFLYNWWLKTFTSSNEIHQHSFVRSKSVPAKTPSLMTLGVL
jgi:hypothetical protein